MKIGQGRESVKKLLTENDDIRDEVEAKIRERADEIFKNMSGEADDEITEEGAQPDTQDEKKKPASGTSKSGGKKAKKNVVIEAEEDFEEFSIDEIDG